MVPLTRFHCDLEHQFRWRVSRCRTISLTGDWRRAHRPVPCGGHNGV